MSRDPLKEPKFGDVFEWGNGYARIMFVRYVTDHEIEAGIVSNGMRKGSWVGLRLQKPGVIWGWFPLLTRDMAYQWRVVP